MDCAHTLLSIIMMLTSSTCHALLNTFLEKNASVQQLPSHMAPDDDSQMTSCDFESPCHWTPSHHGDRSDWVAVSPRQPPGGDTGRLPVADHSVGTPDGHFLLLSVSPEVGTSGLCEHRLTSPVLSGGEGACTLSFALYRASQAVDNLNVLMRPLHSDSAHQAEIFTRHRGHPNRAEWALLDAVIGQVDEPFQVILLYTQCVDEGSGTVALDSLQFHNCDSGPHGTELDVSCGEESFHCDMGSCIEQNQVCDFHADCPLGEDEGFICDALPLGSHCSFERDSCGWSVSDAPSAWRRVAGDELDREEMPQGATLQNTPGHFLFLHVRKSDSLQEASVQSASLPAPVSADACQLHLSLYLFGEFNGSVMVRLEEEGAGSLLLVWQRSSQWTDSWQDVVLLLPQLQHRFSIKVTAAWEQGSQAAVALDDIAIGASCFDTVLSPDLHMADLDDFFSPLPEPSASQISLMTWWFNSCGASGPHGPTQAQCDSTYRNKNINVTVGKEGALRGVQMWRVPATNRYMISAYGAAGGKGAKNHNKRNHGVFISAIFPLEKGDTLYILVGQQGEDACPGRNPLTQKICLGESSVIEDSYRSESAQMWAGGGGGGGGATYVFKREGSTLVPLLIAAGGGGKAYLEDPEADLEQIPLEQYENDTVAASTDGQTGAAGGGGGWRDNVRPHERAGMSLVQGALGGSSCPLAISKFSWSTFGGFGGGGGACSAGGGGGGYRGGDAAATDDITSDGHDGVSFVHPMGDIFLQPLAAMESHGECEVKVQLNCSHCQTQSCKRDEDTHLILCLCHDDDILASDNVTCISAVSPQGPVSQMSSSLILAVVASTVASGIVLICAGLLLMWYRRKNELHAVRGRLQSPEYKLSKIRSSTIMTDYNPNYCFAGKAASVNELKEVPRKNITLLRALGHGAFGEVYEGQVLGIGSENRPMQVAIKTLPEICSEQDEMDFLMEALIMSKFSHENIVRCIGVSLNILPRFILLELMTGGDMKSFLRQNRPRVGQSSFLTMQELLRMARDIACGCRYLEENHFIHRDIAARNCLLTCPGEDRVAKIGDFGMARDIYRASYYRKGGRAMLPVKWMPPEAFMEGIFTCKTDTWSFGVLLWEILSLGYMPYPCKTNQEVLEFVTSGGRMDPPKGCPGPVYRIMTQCWQHCPEHRPNFSTILERINYCTQDPDVINTPLPVEYDPTTEDDGGGVVIRPSDCAARSLSPLLVSRPISQDCSSQLGLSALGLCPSLASQASKPHLLLQQTQPVHHELVDPVPASAWLHSEPSPHRPCSRNNSSSGSQRLKNKTKNLWNPTYGSWVLENFTRGKKMLAHTQSVPLAGAISCPANAPLSPAGNRTNECTETRCDRANGSHPTPPAPCPSSTAAPHTAPAMSSHKSPAGGSTAGTSSAGMDLAKLQSFPCGNVNYAYDEPNYEAEGPPLVVPKVRGAVTNTSLAASASTGSILGLGKSLSHTSSSCMPKLLLKRHASYGHEDVRRHTKGEKPSRDRDSGFSLSEDLSVTSI